MIALSIFVPTLLHALLAVVAPSAQAACTAPYTAQALVKDLGSVQTALRNLDDSAFAASGHALEIGLPCLDQTAPPQLYASAFRYIGAVHFMVQNDPEGARRWFRSSLELDPSYQWDAQELDPSNPILGIWEAERPSAPTEGTRVPDMELEIAAGSFMLLDGRPLVEPTATTGRPHILQMAVTGSRHADRTWLLDGNAFPAEVLRAPAPVVVVEADPKKAKKGKDAKPVATAAPAPVPAAKATPAPKAEPVEKAKPVAKVELAPKAEPVEKAKPVAKVEPAPKAEPVEKAKPVAKVEPAPKAEPVAKSEPAKKSASVATTGEDGTQHLVIQRTRPKEKTPLLLVGGVGLAAAAGLYAYSWKVQQDFNEATTTAELERLQASNHAFVVASGASLLVGVGIGYWGVILDGNTVGFSVGGRF